MPVTTRRFRGPIIAFAIAVMLGMTSYVLSPVATYGAGGYPGPDALPGVPTYGNYLGTIPVGGTSAVSYVCGLDAPNATNHSPQRAVAEINGQISAYLPISTQFGCAEFVVSVVGKVGTNIAPCGFAYASVNGGKWILVHYGTNYLLITGIKHYRHVGAYFPFIVPQPNNLPPSCNPTTTTTTSTTTIPNTSTPTTIHGETTTTGVARTSTTIPGFHTTTSQYNAGSTTTVPVPINGSPGTVIKTITTVVTLIAVVIGAGAAAAGAGQFFIDVPEALVEEYTTEIPPGGGLPYNLFPSGGSGTLTENEMLLMTAGAATDIPPGGGFSMGGVAPSSSVSDEFFALPLGRLEENEEILLFYGGDPEIPGAGGIAMHKITGRTGGMGSAAGDTPTGAGGTIA